MAHKNKQKKSLPKSVPEVVSLSGPTSPVLFQTSTPNELVSAQPSIQTAHNPVSPVTVDSIRLTDGEKALVRKDEARKRKADLKALGADGQSEREVSARSMDSMADEPLAELVIDGVRKFKEIIPAIVELRKRFNERPRGHAGIAGCSTWTEFCTQKLGRTIRAVQLALAQPKTDEEKANSAARKELKARIDLAATRQLAAREESYQQSKALVTKVNEVTPVPTVIPIPRAVPVVVKNQELEEYKLIMAKNIQALELADELLPLLFYGSDGSQHSLVAKYMKLRNIPLFSIPTIE